MTPAEKFEVCKKCENFEEPLARCKVCGCLMRFKVLLPTFFYLSHPKILIMITLIRPILFSFLNSDKVKLLIVDMLTKLAESTDNEVDDKAVEFIRNGLFPAPKL